MSKKTPVMKVTSNLKAGQELRVNPASLLNFMRPALEKYAAEKQRAQDDAATTTTRN